MVSVLETRNNRRRKTVILKGPFTFFHFLRQAIVAFSTILDIVQVRTYIAVKKTALSSLSGKG